MISASPHLYRRQAHRLGISVELVERAIAQAKPPEELGLPSILSLRHLAHRVGVDYNYLREVVARQHDGYKPFLIRKRSGGKRLIAAPEPMLSAVHRWIVDEILVKRPVHPSSFAYSRGSSSIRCAKHHLGAKWLIKIDVHDFFDNISERSVYYVFRECGYQPLVSFELARICTRISTGQSTNEQKWHVNRRQVRPGISMYQNDLMGHLPQGAPTSPLLSNLTSKELDGTLERLANQYDVIYTRYSDDIAFSTGQDITRPFANQLINEVEHVLLSFGHRLHRKKTIISSPGARKVVLGLLVDGDHLKLTREFRRRVSDHVRGIEKFGISGHAANRHFASLWGMVRHILGLLTYAEAVDSEFATPLRIRLMNTLDGQGWPRR